MKAGCWALWLVVLVACESKGEPAAPAAMDTPSAFASTSKGGSGKDGSRIEPEDAPVPESARSLPDVGDCLSACVERNRMRAVSPGQIDGDCKKECNDA